MGNIRVAEERIESARQLSKDSLDLSSLELTTTDLETLISKIGEIRDLKELILSNNQLEMLPPEIGNFTNLKVLDLDKNYLSVLPPEIGNFTNLEMLDLDDNQLGDLPPEIGSLMKLDTLISTGNQLSVLPPEIGNLTNLEKLNLDDNQLSNLPPEIGNLTRLKELSLEANLVEAIPLEIGNLIELQKLKLHENKLRSLPPEIGNLKKLKSLELESNELNILPLEIGGLTDLEILFLGHNELSALPPEIGNLTRLTELGLDDNGLSVLPSQIGNLTRLIELGLEDNQFETMPPEIGNLINLEILGLGSNELRVVPPEIRSLTSLNSLTITNNPLSQETRNFLDAYFEGISEYNMEAFDAISDPLEVLNKIYGEEESEIILTAIEDLDASWSFVNGNDVVIESKDVIKDFLEKIPLTSDQANKMYLKGAKHLLSDIWSTSSSDDDKKSALQKIATALGDCGTPVKDILTLGYIGSYIAKSNDQEIPEEVHTVIVREALEKEILTKLSSLELGPDGGLRDNELTEQVKGLSNAVFLEGAEKYSSNKVKIIFPLNTKPKELPSKSAYPDLAFGMVKDPLAEAFAKLCCKTDEQGTLVKDELGRYLFDSEKLNSIVEKYYKQGLGIVSSREKAIIEFTNAIKKKLQETGLTEHYNDPDVKHLLEIDRQEEELRENLRNVPDNQIETVSSQYLKDQVQKIEVMVEIHSTKTRETENKPSHSLDGLMLPINNNKRMRNMERDSLPESKKQKRERSRSPSRKP